MSSIRRTRTTRSILTTVAIGAVAAIGLVVAAPGSGAFAATNPNSPEARVSHSIESGHLLDDVKSGKITEADVTKASSTGIVVNGQHVDNWTNLTPQQTAEGDALAAKLRAAAEADPKMAASLASTKASIHAAMSANDAPASTTGGSILESKHWYNHLIHWYTLYINHAWLRGLIGVAAGAAAAAICSFFIITGPACSIIGAIFTGLIAEVIRDSASCSGKGLYIKLPDTWNSHCEQ